MAKEGQLLVLGGTERDPDDEASLAALLDPVALEERLREARARRTAALSQRRAEPPADPTAAPASPLRPHPIPPAPPRAAPPPTARRRVPLSWLVFAAGLLLGGAIVGFVSQPDLRSSVALFIAPEIAPEITLAPPAQDDPAPEAVSAPPAAPGAARAVARAPIVAAASPAASDPAAEAPGTPRSDPAPALPPAAEAASARAQVAAAAPAPVNPDAPAPPSPATDDPAAAAAPPAPPAAPGPDGEPAPPAAPALAADLPARIFINYPTSAEAQAAAARDALLAAGATDVSIVPVRFAIAASNVRFYHAADRDGAARVSALIGPELAAGEPATRDFTDYRPPPLAGRVEVWLAGEPAASAARRPAPPVAPALQPEPLPAPLVLPATSGDQAEAVARIIVQRSLERLLLQQPAR